MGSILTSSTYEPNFKGCPVLSGYFSNCDIYIKDYVCANKHFTSYDSPFNPGLWFLSLLVWANKIKYCLILSHTQEVSWFSLSWSCVMNWLFLLWNIIISHIFIFPSTASVVTPFIHLKWLVMKMGHMFVTHTIWVFNPVSLSPGLLHKFLSYSRVANAE